MSSEVPKGRARRFVRMAKASAAAGVGTFFKRGSGDAVAYAADVLSELRGLAAKAGQMTGYVDGFVPAGQRAAFEAAMGKLQQATQASPPEQVRRIVEQELGGSIAELFAEWEDVPFASASIGQVHRARHRDGTLLAVKVQHPGIAEAFEDDLQNAKAIESVVARLVPGGMNVDDLFHEVVERFREELDYVQEAKNIEQFIKLHAGDPSMYIPRVFPELSARRVLSCSYCHGEPLEQAVQHAVTFREHYAETLWSFVTRSIIVGGMFNADPHPGNFLFNKDSKVVFLDFGCVQRFSEERRQHASRLRRAAVERDEAAFRVAVRDWFGARGGKYEEACQRFMRQCFEPIFSSPFRFTPEFAASVVKGLQNFKRVMFSRDQSVVGFPAESVLLNRLQFGFYSVLAKLDVEVDYALVDGAVITEYEAARGAS